MRWLGRFTAWTGMVRHQMRDFEGAARCAEEALAIGLRASDPRTLILVGLLTSTMPRRHRPSLPLLPPLEELYGMAVELRQRDAQSWLLGLLASRAIRQRDYDEAARWTLRRLDLMARSTAWDGMGVSLMASMGVAAGRGELRLAARTHGALAPMLPTLMAGVAPHDAARHQRLIDRLRARLGDAVFDEEVSAGSLLSWPDAVAAVIPMLEGEEDADASSADRGLAVPGLGLTSRERDVLVLLAEGLSNKEIANKLGLRPKTVTQHSMSIYRKLAVRGRSEATAVAIRLRLVPR
jgi:DNA-binding CsgD family transcriptional regulator